MFYVYFNKNNLLCYVPGVTLLLSPKRTTKRQSSRQRHLQHCQQQLRRRRRLHRRLLHHRPVRELFMILCS
jgi:hypothetical protein